MENSILFFSKACKIRIVVKNASIQGGRCEMKNFKQWLLALMAAFMLLGVTTACNGTDTDTDDPETEETENTEEETEESGE